jgi:hypothetical protein
VEENPQKRGEARKMRPTFSDPFTFLYVLGKVKGCGISLGEVATRARKFEAEMNAWINDLEEVERRELIG